MVPRARTSAKLDFQCWNLSEGSESINVRQLNLHPKTICTSACVPSTSSFSSPKRLRRGSGSLLPAWGRLVTCTARGTARAPLALFSSVSSMILIRSSIKQSVRPVVVRGMSNAMSYAAPKGISSGSSFGGGTVVRSGLCSVVVSQSGASTISLARSVTISLKLHQVGGLADPPNVIRSMT